MKRSQSHRHDDVLVVEIFVGRWSKLSLRISIFEFEINLFGADDVQKILKVLRVESYFGFIAGEIRC